MIISSRPVAGREGAHEEAGGISEEGRCAAGAAECAACVGCGQHVTNKRTLTMFWIAFPPTFGVAQFEIASLGMHFQERAGADSCFALHFEPGQPLASGLVRFKGMVLSKSVAVASP
jgi:hypothetical protein